MKWYLRLMVFVFAGFMVFAYAAPDKASKEDNLAIEQPHEERTRKPISSAGEEAIGDLLLQAVSLLGVAYRFGGSSPASGLDCSGFIQYVFKKSLKVNLPRTAMEMARLGQAIERSELVPGDLVFFNTRGFTFSHVGIYMGNGKFIHAPRTGKNVEVANLSQAYWQARYNGARRVDRSMVGEEKLDEDTEWESVQEEAVHPAHKRIHCTHLTKSRKCRRVKGERAPAANAVKRARTRRTEIEVHRGKKRGAPHTKRAAPKTKRRV